MPLSAASSSLPAVLPIEIGSLSTASPNESQFLGSSSGVFFVNTVLRIFASSTAAPPSLDHRPGQENNTPGQTSVDSCIAEQDEHGNANTESTAANYIPASKGHSSSNGRNVQGLGRPPGPAVARQLIMSYFEVWHTIFPFLHGPTFLDQVEDFYLDYDAPHSGIGSWTQLDLRKKVLFQCMFNTAAWDQPENVLGRASRIESPAALLSVVGAISSKHNTPSLQALLAAQLYLIASMSLQAASTVSGMLVRNLFHAGFHRCPQRYVQLSQHDCEIRKRIFWCAYVSDRYLSQALGHPLGIQDSDIDVCITGTRELHKPVPRRGQSDMAQNAEKEALSHLPECHPLLTRPTPTTETGSHYAQVPSDATSSLTRIQSSINPSLPGSPRSRHIGEDVFSAYIVYSRIVGQVLELFHKSIHHRSVENRNILTLTSEVHVWWHNLPQHLQDLPGPGPPPPSTFSFAPFFNVIYQQLVLLVNRPFLSLKPTTAEFRSSLQTCVGASRAIISIVKDHGRTSLCLSAPGIMSATWMSGLVIAFACELDMYPSTKGFREIETCLQLLHTMARSWKSARHCHSTLELLLDSLRSRKRAAAPLSSLDPSSLSEKIPGPHAHGHRPHGSQRTAPWLTPDEYDHVSNGTKRRKTSNNINNNNNGGSSSRRSGRYLNDVGHHHYHHHHHHHHYPPQLDSNPDDAQAVTGTPESDCLIEDFNNNNNYYYSNNPISELEWPDMFGRVSWEALFQGDNEGWGMEFHQPFGGPP